MSANTMTKIAIAPTTKWCDSPDGVVLLNLSSGKYYSLNNTASRIWQGVVRNVPTFEIAKELASVYGIEPALAQADSNCLIESALRLGLLTNAADGAE